MNNHTKHAIQSERRGIRLAGVSATTGSTDTAIAGFPNAAVIGGPYALAHFATITTTAANGTIIKFLRRGKYFVTLSVPLVTLDPAPIQTVAAAISLDTSQLASEPAVGTGTSIRAYGRSRLNAAAATGQTSTITLCCTLHIADILVGAPTLGRLRFHITNGSGATFVDGSVTVAGVLATIEYTTDAAGSQ